jgi:hypothetical protein
MTNQLVLTNMPAAAEATSAFMAAMPDDGRKYILVLCNVLADRTATGPRTPRRPCSLPEALLVAAGLR